MTDEDDDERFPPFTRSRPTDPETSAMAAEDVSAKLKRLRREVFGFFESLSPPHRATLWEVEDFFDDHRSTYRTRVSELVDDGLVRMAMQDGKPLRVFQEGSWRQVWELVPADERPKANSFVPPTPPTPYPDLFDL